MGRRAVDALEGGVDFLFEESLFMEVGLFFQKRAEAFVDFKDLVYHSAIDCQPIGTAGAAQHAGAGAGESPGCAPGAAASWTTRFQN